MNDRYRNPHMEIRQPLHVELSNHAHKEAITHVSGSALHTQLLFMVLWVNTMEPI